jgi:hypothetical protein
MSEQLPPEIVALTRGFLRPIQRGVASKVHVFSHLVVDGHWIRSRSMNSMIICKFAV